MLITKIWVKIVNFYLSFQESNNHIVKEEFMDKDYIRAVSNFDQAGAHLGNFAMLLSTYHKALCEAGFQRDEALQLVKEMQKTLFDQAFNMGPQNSSDDE